jgi:hypothetical protein
VAERRERLRRSIRHYRAEGRFERLVLADATLDHEARRELRAEFPFLELPVLSTEPRGSHDGPSYLEALLYGAVVDAGVLDPADGSRWVKVTGGYVVANLDAILAVADRHCLAGLCYLMQHPLRPRPRFALSAFVVLDAGLMHDLLTRVARDAERARFEPLEGLVLEFLKGETTTRVRAPYPRIDAFHATAGKRSDALSLLPTQLAWRALSALGFYAYGLPAY